METSPKISVLMCTYNHELYIAQAIEGVLSQKCDVPFELLVGDDCGTDGTRDIVLSYAAKYPSIVKPVFPEHNLGASRNIINLAEHAEGEILSICDGDDWWHTDKILQTQWNIFLSELEVGMCCAKAKCFHQNEQAYQGILGYDGAESLERMVFDNQDVAAPTIAFRRNLFLKCASESAWYIEQNCFYDSIMAYWFAYNSQVRFIDEELASYRVLDNSACHANDLDKSAAYSRRYFSVKWRFLLEHPMKPELMHKLLMNEYDRACGEAGWMNEMKIRKSKAYRLGKFFTNQINRLK